MRPLFTLLLSESDDEFVDRKQFLPNTKEKKIIKLIIVSLIVAFMFMMGSGKASGQALGTYDFSTMTTGCPALGYTVPTTSNATFSQFSRSTITCNSTAGTYNSTTLNATSAVVTTSYIQFSITAGAGFQLNLTSLAFTRQASNSAPNQLQVSYSTDNFATHTDVQATNSPTTAATYTWDFADFSTGNAGTVTFRLYPYGTQRADLTGTAASSSGTFRINNLTLNGTVTAAAACTNPTDVTSQAATNGNAQSIVSWTNGACFDEIMVVASSSSFTSALPSGDGSAYTANSTSFTDAGNTSFDGGKVIYKSTGATVTVTSLTNGSPYNFKIFARKGNNWSNGVTTSATPALSAYYWNGGNTLANPAAGGTGTWSAANAWRQPNASGAQATWADNNPAILAGTAGIVSISATVNATNVTPAVTGYTITPSSGTQTLNAPIIVGNGINFNLFDNTTTGGLTFNIGGNVSGTGTGAITLQGTPTSANTNRLNLSVMNTSISVPVSIVNTGAGQVGIVSTNTGNAVSGNITNNSSGATMIGATSGNALAIGGIISGSANVQFQAGSSGGAGVITLNAASNYTGSTIFNMANSGKVVLGIDNALPTTSNLSMGFTSSNGGILDLNGHNQTIGTLTSGVGGGSITNGGASNSTLTITQASDQSFSLNITDGATMKTAIVKAGASRLTLTGLNYTFSGGVTINNGELRYNTSANVGTSTATASPLTLSGGTLATTGISAGRTINFNTLTLTNNAAINLDNTNSSIINFAASNGNSWTSGKTLTITGWIGAYDGAHSGTIGQIFVGTDATGLTPSQLGEIVFVDASNITHNAVILSTGEIVPATAPSVSFDPTPVAFGSISAGSQSSSTTVILTATNLSPASGTLNVTAPNSDFQVSNDNSTWVSSTTITYSSSGSTIGNLYVKFTPQAGGNKSGNVVVTGGGLPVSGASLPVSGVAFGTYTWNVSSGNWSAASSWNPNLNNPSAGDILIFDGNITPSPTVTVNANSSFGQITFKNNINATLTVATAQTLTVSGEGTADADLDINNGSTLNVTNSAAAALVINIATGATGEIDGTASFNGASAAAFKLQSIDPGSILVNGTVSTGANFSSNLFGAGTGASGLNSVVFNSGSTYIQGGGSNPFGASAPSTVVVFNDGSNFKFTAGGSATPSIANRSYANFEWNAPTNTASNSSASNNPFSNNSSAGVITGNFVVSGGNFTASGSAGFTLGGDLIVQNANDTFKFTPIGTGAGIVFNGSTDQQISNNGGVLQFKYPATITISKSSGDVKLGSDVTLKNVSMASGNTANLIIGAHTLTLDGQFSSTATDGAIGGSVSSNLTLDSVAGNLYFTSGLQMIKNLSLESGASASLATSLSIASVGNISVANGGSFNTNGKLTLKSDADGTAYVNSNTSGSTYISGNVNVERYIQPNGGTRAWRLLAVPTQGSQTINAAWQEGQTAGANNGSGFGTIITAGNTNAGWASEGFDYQQQDGSMLTYNAAANSWSEVTNINSTSLATTSGYFLYIRGNRSVVPSSSSTGTTVATLRSSGPLYEGDVATDNIPAGQFALIGNVYASPLNFTATTKSNIDGVFYVWDPKIHLGNSLGAYQTFSSTTSTPWTPLIPGGSYTAGVGNTIIQTGQAFFVHSTDGNGSITLTEGSKVTGFNDVFRPEAPSGVSSQLTTNLYEGPTNDLSDVAVSVFGNYSNAVDKYDAIKLSNNGINMGILRNGKVLAIEGRQAIINTDTIFYDIWNLKPQQYKLEFVANGLENVNTYLLDSYLGTKSAIDLSTTNSISFTVDANSASSATDRFALVFSSNSPVPVTYTNVKALQQDNGITVEWNVTNQSNIKEYTVEKSTDGITFTAVATIKSTSANVYSWMDLNVVNNDNYYRVRSTGSNGSMQYSQVVNVKMGNKNPAISVYPSIVTGHSVTLQLMNQPKGMYGVRLVNTAGQLMFKSTVSHAGGNSTQTLSLPATMANGMYKIEIVSPWKSSYVQKLIIQ